MILFILTKSTFIGIRQGQLYLTNRKLCYLVIWTPNQTIITEVEKDPDWFVNLKVLEQFFITKLIPFLIEN